MEVLRTRERLGELDERLEELVRTEPSGEVVRSLPGMGLVLTAEFLAEVGDVRRFGSADRLAAAAGIVPALRASGSVSYRRRARRGNRILKRIFYRSAFSAISCHDPSQAYYRRKRAEGKAAQQAVIALAHRRVNVLWAMLRDGAMYEDRATATDRKRRQDALSLFLAVFVGTSRRRSPVSPPEGGPHSAICALAPAASRRGEGRTMQHLPFEKRQ